MPKFQGEQVLLTFALNEQSVATFQRKFMFALAINSPVKDRPKKTHWLQQMENQIAGISES